MKNPSFPKEYAQTLNFTLGAPRTFRISRDGKRVYFLRSESSTERALDLWCLANEQNTGPNEQLVVRFKDLQRSATGGKHDPDAERARKERLREAAGGITSYAIDDLGTVVAFAINGNVYACNIQDPRQPAFLSVGDASHLKVSPDGHMLSYIAGRELFVAKFSESKIQKPRRISPPASEAVSWGLPEFVAAEEMHRRTGYWWSPDSKTIIFAKIDESAVPTWYISNPSDPEESPSPIRYPHAGAANALVSLFVWSQNGDVGEIKWDKEQFPYLVAVRWKKNEATIAVQDRSQQQLHLLRVNATSGETADAYKKTDTLWVELIPGVPAWSTTESIVDTLDGEFRCLYVGGKQVSKPGLEVRKYIGEMASGGFVYLSSDDPKETHVWLSDGRSHTKLSQSEGVFDAKIGGDTVVIFGAALTDNPLRAEIVKIHDKSTAHTALKSNASKVSIEPRPKFIQSRIRKINYALIYPQDVQRGRKLPILFDPYGGPLVQRCIKSSLSFTTSQWFANQGFVVIVADGRGTPGRGRLWEKAIVRNLVGPTVDDQVAVLEHVVETNPHVDPDRVAIRGWSFGGYLAIFCVLSRPDKFHAAIAGAPVTDWRLYDTHYTERYLGDPVRSAQAYDSCSAIAAASRLERPLLLIHGLSDDNVVSAHTLRLSQALFERGRQHNVLPLTGITHMAASESAAENLLHAQLSFLQVSLGLT